MKYRGVVYDVGLQFEENTLSVKPFDPFLVEYDLRAIAHDLHANAVRLEGEPIQRLATAARTAHAMGLTVFFNPWKMHAGISETRDYLEQLALVAEQLRTVGVDIIFFAGCEYTVFSNGVFPGDSFNTVPVRGMSQFAG